jgi:hypothetical protein
MVVVAIVVGVAGTLVEEAAGDKGVRKRSVLLVGNAGAALIP